MEQRDSFYVTLNSTPTKEFPQNTSFTFQRRLPVLLDLTKPGWKVGLHSLFLPYEGNQVLTLGAVPSNIVLVHVRWIAEPNEHTTTTLLLDIPKSVLISTVRSTVSQYEFCTCWSINTDTRNSLMTNQMRITAMKEIMILPTCIERT